ncbi:DUF6247 family protein [Streptomyces avidinii]|uniref:DUF6247 family protein n=1 Tax=Streptomyces avidinii TaxID=1895 RepID=UPI00386CD173|nr:DUF6247 family protein [Streptomyces avidinii]
MSAQPDHRPATPYAPAPGAPATLRAQLRAAQWVPTFEREWAAALEESRRVFSLAGLYAVVQDWQGRLAHAPAAKVLDTLPEHAEATVWDVLDAAAADPWGFGQWNADDPEGQGRALRGRRPTHWERAAFARRSSSVSSRTASSRTSSMPTRSR